jgi:folate-binding protein YgfZ
VRRLGADAATVEAVERGAYFTHRAVTLGDAQARLVRVPDLGDATTLDLHLSRDVASHIMTQITAAGGALSDAAEWHRRRVLAFRPEWGVEMDESTLAQEANMDALHAISYKKGCYTGQETVARVHFRGHVNRTLRRVVYGAGVMPAAGTALTAADGAPVGDSRSVALDDAGQALGIAMLRREVGDGAQLTWSAADGSAHLATVIGSADEA